MTEEVDDCIIIVKLPVEMAFAAELFLLSDKWFPGATVSTEDHKMIIRRPDTMVPV